MRRVLCVAEKPSIAKAVANFLAGNSNVTVRNTRSKYVRNYAFNTQLDGETVAVVVTALLGHLMSVDFPAQYRSWASCDPIQLFCAAVSKVVTERAVADNLQAEARGVRDLVLWTDCDREGEAIGCEVAALCTQVNPNLVVRRAHFAVVQRADILRAWNNLGVLDLRQADAVEARSELDLRIGAAFTRMQTLHLQNLVQTDSPLSYGSCQFPTLYFVVDRYKRASRFTPEPFWKIDLSVSSMAASTETCKLLWDRGHLFSFHAAFVLFEDCVASGVAVVESVDCSATSRFPPFPLNTVEMQKFASSYFGMSGDITMKIAEKLYQRGFISYPRTETDSFAPNFHLKQLIRAQTSDSNWGQYATELLDSPDKYRFPRRGRANDNAHPPIHPTEQIPTDLQANEKKLYEFIVRRFLACCSKPALGDSTVAKIRVGSEMFTISGVVIRERNYLDVYPYDKWSSTVIPSFLKQGETLRISDLKLTEGKTTKPNLLTEAELITLMEKNGIGTDATIHEHIAKIIQRGYANKTGKYFVPSVLGVSLIEAYDEMHMRLSLAKPYLRAKMEANMQLICEGKKTRKEVVDETVREYEDAFRQASRQRQKFTETINRNAVSAN